VWPFFVLAMLSSTVLAFINVRSDREIKARIEHSIEREPLTAVYCAQSPSEEPLIEVEYPPRSGVCWALEANQDRPADMRFAADELNQRIAIACAGNAIPCGVDQVTSDARKYAVKKFLGQWASERIVYVSFAWMYR
jgi:hypothetical protein